MIDTSYECEYKSYKSHCICNHKVYFDDTSCYCFTQYHKNMNFSSLTFWNRTQTFYRATDAHSTVCWTNWIWAQKPEKDEDNNKKKRKQMHSVRLTLLLYWIVEPIFFSFVWGVCCCCQETKQQNTFTHFQTSCTYRHACKNEHYVTLRALSSSFGSSWFWFSVSMKQPYILHIMHAVRCNMPRETEGTTLNKWIGRTEYMLRFCCYFGCKRAINVLKYDRQMLTEWWAYDDCCWLYFFASQNTTRLYDWYAVFKSNRYRFATI